MIFILQQHWEKVQQEATRSLQSNLSRRVNNDRHLLDCHKRTKERLQPQLWLALAASITLGKESMYTTYLRYQEWPLESLPPQVLALLVIVRDLEMLNQQDCLVIGKD